MHYSASRWRSTGIVLVRASGTVAAEDMDRLFHALDDACREGKMTQVVLDFSGVSYIPSTRDARAIAQRIVELASPARCRIALVASQETAYGMTRMIEILASIQNVDALAFKSVDEAVDWLSGEAPDPSGSAPASR